MDSIVVDRDIRISTVGRDDYPELEGKVIEYIQPIGIVQKGIVVGCNRSLGLTVVEVSNKDHYLICIVGKSAPRPSNFANMACTYDELFDWVVEGIEEGVIFAQDMTMMHSPAYLYGGSPTGENCAYGQ